EYSLPTQNCGAMGITKGPDGALWFTEAASSRIGRITAQGAVTEYSLPTPSAAPTSITVGPNGTLWFTESRGNQIGSLTLSK
ncbi:MAG TPA: Virginiamycin B lyase, partial [Ktedonobacteraceae bacterium]|nr:Virginiamycin B lyase [Ktedonobacteraceae bacterium]